MNDTTRRRLLAQLAACAAGMAWVQGAIGQQAQGGVEHGSPPPKPGTPLPLPAVPLLDGGNFRPESADGQVLVLYWWASWCPFCALQSPLMNKLWLAQRGRGLQMLGLSIDKTPEEARAYLATHSYAFPSGWVTPAVAKALPRPRGLPVTIVRGRDGRVLMAEAGQLFAEDIEEIARFL